MNIDRMIRNLDQTKLQELSELVDAELEKRTDRSRNQRACKYGYTPWGAELQGYRKYPHQRKQAA